jgi:hypothetical protein
MQMINVNGIYVNLDCLAFARPDRGIDGKIKLRSWNRRRGRHDDG